MFLHFWQFYEAYDIDWNTVSLSDRSIPMVFKLAWIQRTKLQLVAINLFLCWIVALEYLYIQENFAMMVKIILGMLHLTLTLTLIGQDHPRHAAAAGLLHRSPGSLCNGLRLLQLRAFWYQ